MSNDVQSAAGPAVTSRRLSKIEVEAKSMLPSRIGTDEADRLAMTICDHIRPFIEKPLREEIELGRRTIAELAKQRDFHLGRWNESNAKVGEYSAVIAELASKRLELEHELKTATIRAFDLARQLEESKAEASALRERLRIK